MDCIKKYGKHFVFYYLTKQWGLWGMTELMKKICVIRAVTSVDGMTAEAYKFSHEFPGNMFK